MQELVPSFFQCTVSKIIMFTSSVPNFGAGFDDLPCLYVMVIRPLLAACSRALATHQLRIQLR